MPKPVKRMMTKPEPVRRIGARESTPAELDADRLIAIASRASLPNDDLKWAAEFLAERRDSLVRREGILSAKGEALLKRLKEAADVLEDLRWWLKELADAAEAVELSHRIEESLSREIRRR